MKVQQLRKRITKNIVYFWSIVTLDIFFYTHHSLPPGIMILGNIQVFRLVISWENTLLGFRLLLGPEVVRWSIEIITEMYPEVCFSF